jgi:hypothetical protein
MNKLFLFSLFLLTVTLASAQDSIRPQMRDTSWKISGFFGLNVSETSLSNWQGGGQDNQALNGIFNLAANYKRDVFEEWSNKIDAQYGFVRLGYKGMPRKSIDQLFALSKYEIMAFKKVFFYTLQGDYRTQFAPGYKYDGNTVIKPATSDFNSPGYVQLALGLSYKPQDYFSVTLAPLAGKMTIVNRQYLADAGAYGVQAATYDDAGNMTAHGKKIRYEFGGRLIVKFKKDIMKNVNLDSYLDLFSNYSNNPQNIDVVFNNLITFKINKFFTASVICQMIYDDDIKIKRDLNQDGQFNGPGEFNGPRLQVLSTIGIGFGYKF